MSTGELPEDYQSEEEEEENNGMQINLLEAATRSISIEENRIRVYPAGYHYANRPNFSVVPTAEGRFHIIKPDVVVVFLAQYGFSALFFVCLNVES